MNSHPAVELPLDVEVEENLPPSNRGDTTAPVGLEATRLVEILETEWPHGMLYITGDGQRAEEVASCLAGLLPDQSVLLFPPLDALPHEQPSARWSATECARCDSSHRGPPPRSW